MDLCQWAGHFHKPKAAGLPAAFLRREAPLQRGFLKSVPQAHRNSSLFSIHWSRQGGISRPGKPALLPGIAKELLPAGAGGSVPWRPPMAERACGHLLPSHSSAPEESHTPANPPRFLGTPENCSPQGRSAQMWQEPAVPPQTPPPKPRRWGLVVGSACAAAFFHRGIIPLLTLFFSASGSQKTAVTPCGGISSLAALVNHEGKRKFSSPT